MQKHPLDQLYDLKRELIERVRLLEARLRELQVINPPRIRELSQEADRLAGIFKPLVQEAVDAYEADEKALAKEISERRRSIQAVCEGLNAQANALRKEIADAKQAIIDAKLELANMKSKISRYEYLMQITIDGFEQAHGVSIAIVREELSALPMSILQHIKRVAYVHQAHRTGEVGRTASREENPDQTTISLFVDSTYLKHWDKAKLEESYRHSIIHEAGHVFFDWVLEKEERDEWGELYLDTKRKGGEFITENAEVSKREDFGECFHMYIHDPEALRKLDPGRYTFIDKVYMKEVNR